MNIRKTSKFLLLATFVILLLVTGCSSKKTKELETQIEEQQKMIVELQKTIQKPNEKTQETKDKNLNIQYLSPELVLKVVQTLSGGENGYVYAVYESMGDYIEYNDEVYHVVTENDRGDIYLHYIKDGETDFYNGDTSHLDDLYKSENSMNDEKKEIYRLIYPFNEIEKVELTIADEIEVRSDMVNKGIFKNVSQENAFKDLVKDHYDIFKSYFSVHSKIDDLDGYAANVHSGFLPPNGYTAIIMITDDDKIWAALCGDEYGEEVRYFTNASNHKELPRTINEWRSGFNHMPVYYTEYDSNNLVKKTLIENISSEQKVQNTDERGSNQIKTKQKPYSGHWKCNTAYWANFKTNQQMVKNIDQIDFYFLDNENTIKMVSNGETLIRHYKENILPSGKISLYVNEVQEFLYFPKTHNLIGSIHYKDGSTDALDLKFVE